MTKIISSILACIFVFLSTSSLNMPGVNKSTKSINSIYKSLDPYSVIQQFAFYELYPDTKEGKLALKKAWELLNQSDIKTSLTLPTLNINLMIELVNKQSATPPESLQSSQLEFIENLGKNLSNRKLKGNKLWKIDDIVKLPVHEVDLSRGLFLEELADQDNTKYKIRYYEACLDLMALQILARLPNNATDYEKMDAISDFIFYKMRFRFPPHSEHAKDIDTYTFLPSVMDSRRGVCLGVSILYLCIAQRLDLPLEIITPPGHIYIRYNDNGKITNIETTARGVNYPSEVYLGIETKGLQLRNIKQTVGLAFINQAAVFWGNENYEMAVNLYEKAKKYLPNDYLLTEFLGFNYLFIGKIEEGKKLLNITKDHIPDYATSKDTIAEDYLNGHTDIDGIKSIFQSVDATRKSIIKKQKHLKEITKKYPKFRAGLMQYASSFMQLGREKEAKKILEQYYKIDQEDPTVNYYLSVICYQRYDFNSSWKYYRQAKALLDEKNHQPKALDQLYDALKRTCPEPKS